jgi:hypothetical protein
VLGAVDDLVKVAVVEHHHGRRCFSDASASAGLVVDKLNNGVGSAAAVVVLRLLQISSLGKELERGESLNAEAASERLVLQQRNI